MVSCALLQTVKMPIDVAMAGEYERTISLFRTSYSFVATARQHVPRELALLWLSQYAPDMSSFTPMYIQAEKLPKAFITGNMHSYNPDSAWWSFSVAGNWASRFYSHAIVEVRKVQMSIESQLSRESAMVEERVMQLIAGKGAEGARGEVRELLSDFTSSRGQLINRKWKDLFLFLVPSFRDGYHVTGLEQESVTPTSMFYPKWWLEATGYFTDTFRNDMPGHIVFGANPLTGQSSTFSIQLLLGALLIFTAGWASAKYSRAGVLGSNREQYTELSSI